MFNNRYEYELAKRFRKADSKQFSDASLRLSVWSISLGIAVMILSISIVTGFQQTIRNKLASFEGHIQISRFDNNKSFDLQPIEIDPYIEALGEEDHRIESIAPFILKGAVIKSKEALQGCVVKGIDEGYRWEMIKTWLVEGHLPNYADSSRSNEILISTKLSSKLLIKTGDAVFFYFMQDPPRARKWTVAGIYDSGFEEFDQRYVFADIRHLQRINQWNFHQISGYEISLNNYDQMSKVTEDLYENIDYNLRAMNLNERYPYMMDWLALLDTNVYFILLLMLLISSVGMISTLLILILEKTRFIGTLKALGAKDFSIRKVFIYHLIFLLTKSLIIGNGIGLGLAFLQWKFQWIPLDTTNYYMSYIPISWPWTYFLLINLLIVIIIVFTLWLPTRIISKISPVKTLRFD